MYVGQIGNIFQPIFWRKLIPPDVSEMVSKQPAHFKVSFFGKILLDKFKLQYITLPPHKHTQPITKIIFVELISPKDKVYTTVYDTYQSSNTLVHIIINLGHQLRKISLAVTHSDEP